MYKTHHQLFSVIFVFSFVILFEGLFFFLGGGGGGGVTHNQITLGWMVNFNLDI